MRSLDEKPYIELLDGEPLEKVSPKRIHAILQWRLAARLQALAGDRGVVGTEWRFWLHPIEPYTSLLPDVAYVSNERLALLTDEEQDEPAFAPDVAVEIRSPSDHVKNVEWKMHAYLQSGCRVGFDVIPESRTIRVFTQASIETLGERARFASADLPWLAFDVSALFETL